MPSSGRASGSRATRVKETLMGALPISETGGGSVSDDPGRSQLSWLTSWPGEHQTAASPGPHAHFLGHHCPLPSLLVEGRSPF